MSIPLVINGATFNYPVNFDESWGIDATGWAQAVTNGMLQRAGGNFPLTADVNFGASFGLISLYYKSRSAPLATSGTLRLASADPGVTFRNNANSGNLILTTDASDNLLYNGHILSPSSAGTVTSITGTANQVIASTPTGNVTLSLPQSIATTSSPTFLAETLSHSGLILQDTEGTPKAITLSAPVTLSTNWALSLPINAGSNGQVLQTDGTGLTSWVNAAGGGTINSGTQYQLAFYATTGTTLSGSTSITTDVNGFLTIAGNSPTLTLNNTTSADSPYIQGGVAGDGYLSLTGGMSRGVKLYANNTGILLLTANATTLTSTVPLAMGANKITGLANGSASSDAAAFGQIVGSFVAPTVQRFTSGSGTYTTPTSPRSPVYIKVRMVGGGGGGSGSGTIGGGATNGSAGTNTDFASNVAGAGAGGIFAADNSGTGGTGTIGTGTLVLNIPGGAGSSYNETTTAGDALFGGGTGGSTHLGLGGNGRQTAQNGASPTNGTGAGGQGGGNGSLGINNASGSGGGGGAYIEVIIGSPLVSYSYSVGSAGGGGSAGSQGNAGGSGASGLIVVEEYYQ